MLKDDFLYLSAIFFSLPLVNSSSPISFITRLILNNCDTVRKFIFLYTISLSTKLSIILLCKLLGLLFMHGSLPPCLNVFIYKLYLLIKTSLALLVGADTIKLLIYTNLSRVCVSTACLHKPYFSIILLCIKLTMLDIKIVVLPVPALPFINNLE